VSSIEGHRLEPAFRVMLATGLRPAELLALRQDDLGPTMGMLRVQRKVVRLKNGRGLEIGEPKTHQGRSMKLGRSVVAALRAWQVARSGLRDKAGPRWQEPG
jgi:integrase